MPRGYTEIGGPAAAATDDAECCLIGGMDPNIKGGIIGGTLGAGPFQTVNAVVQPFPRSLLIGTTVFNLDAIEPAGAYHEVHMERFGPTGTLVTGPLYFLINTAVDGQPRGSVINARGWMPIAKGQAIQAAQASFGPSPSTALGWASEVRGILRCQPMFASGVTSFASGGTRYCMPFQGQGNSTIDQAKHPVTANAVIRNLVVRTTTQQPSGGALVVTLVVNGSDSAMTVSVPASANSGAYRETSPAAVSVAEDDVIWWKIVNNGSSNSATIGAIDADMIMDVAGESGIVVFPNPSIAVPGGANTTGYLPAYANSAAQSATEGPVRRPLPRAGTGKNLKVFISSSSADTCTFTIMVNGVASSMFVSVGSGVSGLVAGTGTHVFSEGDEISLRIVQGNAVPTINHTSAAFTLQDA